MSMVNISHDHGGTRDYSTSSEYIRELIRKDQDRLRLRNLLLDGAGSSPTTTADAEYFDRLRDACPPGDAYAVAGGEARSHGGECASCVAVVQPGLRVEDALDRRR